jgi:anti-sigma factor RsiW
MPTCEDIQEEFSALLDDALDIETRDTIEAHLCDCSDCLRELHSLKRASDLYRAQPRVRAPEDFQEQVMRALEPRTRRAGFLHRLSRPGPLLALAATLLLVSGLGLMQYYRGITGYQPDRERFALTHAEPVAQTASAPRAEQAATVAEDAAVPPAPVSTARVQQQMALEAPADAVAMAAPEAEEAEQGMEAFGAPPAQPLTMAAEAPPPPAPEPLRRRMDPGSAPPPPAAPAIAQSAGDRAVARPEAAESPAQRAPAAAPAQVEVLVGERRFVLQEQVWQEAHYAGEPVETLDAGTDAYAALLAEDPELQEAIDLGPEVIVQTGEVWYRLRRES